MANGEFPARTSFNPLLPDQTIEELNRLIRPRRVLRPRDRSRREPLFLFMILDSASEAVTLTWPGATLEGDTIYPSVYVGEIARHYAASPVVQLSRGLTARESSERFRMIADAWRDGRMDDAEAEQLLGVSIVRRAQWEAKGIERGNIGHGVLPIDTPWHPSELNALASCPFTFLARRRLKLRATSSSDFDVASSEIGILAHAILRDFYAGPALTSHAEAEQRMNNVIARHLAPVDVNGQGPYSVFDPGLWRIRRKQLVSALLQYVDFAVHDAVDGYETLPEYLDNALPPSRLGQTLLGGKPDHVAVFRTNGRVEGVRVDDFKYSAASGSTTRQLKESLQVPVYAWLALQALGVSEGVPVEGRYLLLRSPSHPVVSYPIDQAVFDQLRIRIDALVDKVQRGMLHPQPADRQDCPECDYRRLCRINGG
jgi:hypothetical protein